MSTRDIYISDTNLSPQAYRPFTHVVSDVGMKTTSNLSDRRWLIVDDNEQVADLLALLLGSLGLAEVEKHTSARDAYARAQMHVFDLVVTDRDMPGLDGLELARWLHAELPAVKIVLISAHVDDLTDDDLRRAGICAVLPKPFSLHRLEAIVRSLACEPGANAGSLESAAARRAA